MEGGLLGWPTWIGVVVEDLGKARRVEGDGSSWAYFRDPEGNIFEITRRPVR